MALGASLAGQNLDGRAHDYATAVFYVALGIWAYGEITEGANWVRRLLGVAGLAYVVIELAAALD